MNDHKSISRWVCLLICVCIFLCACSTREDFSDAPSLPTVGKVQGMAAAMERGWEILSRGENLFGAPVFSMARAFCENGIRKETLTVHRLSVMGSGYIGQQPLTLLEETKLLDGTSHTVGTLSSGEETLHFRELELRDGRYLSIPGVAEGDFLLTDVSHASVFSYLYPLLAALETAPEERLITAASKDGGTEYAFITETKDGLPFAVTVFAADNSFALSAEQGIRGNGLLRTSLSLIRSGADLSFGLKTTHDSTTVLEMAGNIAITRRSITLQGACEQKDKQTAFEIDLTAESEGRVAFSGTVTELLSDGSVPMLLQGSLSKEKEQISLYADLESSIPGYLDMDMEYQAYVTPETPVISQKDESKEWQKTDGQGLADSLRSTYPSFAELYDALFSGKNPPTEGVTGVTYRDENGSLILSLFGDGTVGLSLEGRFWMENGLLSLSYFENRLFYTPYTVNENNTYMIWNTTFTHYGDSSVDTYTYQSPDGAYWIELMPAMEEDGIALLDLCLPVTVQENTLDILMPDGSTLTLPYLAEEDGLTVRLWEIPLKYVVSE